MTCDEAKERAVFFRAALTSIVDSGPDLLFALEQAKVLLKRYPFDPEALTILRKMAKGEDPIAGGGS